MPNLRLSTAISLFLTSLALLQTAQAASSPSSWSSGFEGPRANFLETVLEGNIANQKSCKPTGLIQDACCDYQTVEEVNDDLASRLTELIQLPFFRYQRVDLFRECPFWHEDGSCANRACAVEETEEADIPPAWRSKCLGQVKSLELNPTSRHRDADFCVLDEDAPEGDGVYVDLYENPERFTGYAGHSANRVWKAIYEENCFGVVPFLPPSSSMETGGTGYIGKNLLSNNNQGVRSLMGSLGLAAPRDPQSEEQCREKRVYYRLISGLHASISIHICAEYLDQKSGEWRPNLECFITRIAEHPERLQNVYFDYVLMLRALTKAAPYLRTFNYTLGDTTNDEQTKTLVKALLDKTESCTATFDETSMFTGGPEARILKQEFKDHFRNVSRIMDCVGCDKCRLWGKTQVTGLATALKLLFSFDESACRSEDFSLKRSEIISFIWTLHRFSESLAAVEHFRNMWAQRNNAEEPVKSSPRSAASEPTSNLDPQPSSRSAPTNTAAMYDIPDAEETSVSKFHSPLVDAGSTTFASNKTGVMSPRHSAFAKSDFLAKLYHTCRNSFAACFMILERVISIVSSRILDSKQEL